jgi:hypothetical protein
VCKEKNRSRKALFFIDLPVFEGNKNKAKLIVLLLSVTSMPYYLAF